MHPRAANVFASLLFALCACALFAAGSASAQNQCTAQQYTYNYANYCPYPVWIAQTAAASNSQSFPPLGGNWALSGTCTANSQCSSGTCDQSTAQCTCSTSSDCTGGATCGPSGTCSTTSTFCMPQTWNSGTFWPRTGCTAPDSTHLNCETGQCTASGNTNGLLDCGVGITSPTNPVTQFEVTSSAGSVNYDVSLVAGANVEMNVVPVGGYYPVPGVAAPQNQVACYAAGCSADLDATCPVSLQVKSGSTVIGCLDPCTQCQRTAPNGSTPNATIYAALNCASPITKDAFGNAPGATTLCSGAAGGAPTYLDMYCAANFADTGTPAQASTNQGSPTAFSQSDCFPGTTYVVPTFANVNYKAPPGAGVCVYASPPQNSIAGFNDYGWADYASGKTLSCGSLADGTACGGYLTGQVDTLPSGGTATATYPSALGYTCQTATYLDTTNTQETAHLCMPPTVSGLGQCTYDSLNQKPLYTGGGGVYNASWLTAGLQAGGGTTPYYQTFKAACSESYTWQYDDASSGFGCQVPAPPSGQAFSGFDVTFCGSLAPRSIDAVRAARIVFSAGHGDAEHVGAPGNRGSIRISGRFRLAGRLLLDEATLRLTDVLHEAQGAGELVRGARNGHVVPITMDASRGSRSDEAVFATERGASPEIDVRIRRLSPSADAIEFSLVVDRAAIVEADRCAAGHRTTTIRTGFDLAVGPRTVHIAATLPWQCDGTTLRLP